MDYKYYGGLSRSVFLNLIYKLYRTTPMKLYNTRLHPVTKQMIRDCLYNTK